MARVVDNNYTVNTEHQLSNAGILPLKVLISSASHKIPLLRAMETAARSIHPSAEVVAGDVSPNALSAYVANSFWHMPRTVDENLDLILAGCRKRGITSVLPTRDDELLFWSRHADTLRVAGIEVLSSRLESLELCIDKLEFSRFGVREQLPFIPTSLHINDINAEKYVIKERFGAGARSIGIGLSHDEAIIHANSLKQPVFQPYVKGVEISIDAWLDRQSKVKGLVLRRREVVISGESRVTTTFHDEKIEQAAARILERLDLYGPIVMQVIIDGDGNMHVIECNARFGGASTTSIAAGLDTLRWSLLEAIGEDIKQYPFNRLPGEVRQIRVPGDLYIYDPDT
ncbi:ATP-grasp domain-containing protein [Zobellella sp. An-6]|uniref:ATP-grasp domain-containing protein n=1 Tax=Zobellella sp. An-6 TaxID=3400218 RepID=UPI004042120B